MDLEKIWGVSLRDVIQDPVCPKGREVCQDLSVRLLKQDPFHLLRSAGLQIGSGETVETDSAGLACSPPTKD